MAPQTTMVVYRGLVLECQHCYVICRYTEAAVRHNCPACGRSIANWQQLTVTAQAEGPEPSSGSSAAEGRQSTPP